MALTFTKKAAAGSSASPAADQQNAAKPSLKQKAAANVTWFKKGKEAQEALALEEAKAELAKAEAGRLWRHMLKEGEEKQLTFLDGDLDADGMLDILMFYQHTLFVNGNWMNFVCTAEADQTQPCPICAGGDRPALVGVMTVIDHSEHEIQKGPNKGNILKNQRRLFVAKRGTIKHLTKLAVKRGGLAGCTFDVSRTGDKEPNVGNQFDFVEKHDNLAALAAILGLNAQDCQPANYQEEIRYHSPEELIELGVGKAASGPGYSKASGTSALKDEL